MGLQRKSVVIYALVISWAGLLSLTNATGRCLSCYQGKLFAEAFGIINALNSDLPEIADIYLPTQSDRCTDPDSTVSTKECNNGLCLSVLLNVPGTEENAARACLPHVIFDVPWITELINYFNDFHVSLEIGLPQDISHLKQYLPQDISNLKPFISKDPYFSAFDQKLENILSYISQMSSGKVEFDVYARHANPDALSTANADIEDVIPRLTPNSCYQGKIFRELFDIVTPIISDVHLPFPVEDIIRIPSESGRCTEPDSTVDSVDCIGGKFMAALLVVPGVGDNIARSCLKTRKAFNLVPIADIGRHHELGDFLTMAIYNASKLVDNINHFHVSMGFYSKFTSSSLKRFLHLNHGIRLSSIQTDLMKDEEMYPDLKGGLVRLIDFLDEIVPGKFDLDILVGDAKQVGNGGNTKQVGNALFIFGYMFMAWYIH